MRHGWVRGMAFLAAAAFLPGLAAPLAAEEECVVVRGRVALPAGPVPWAPVAVYDLVHAPGSEALAPVQDPSRNRDDAAKRLLWQGSTQSDGSFESSCLATPDSTSMAGTIDLALAVRADTPVADVRTPGLVTRTLEQASGYYAFPSSGEPSWTYAAWSWEYRNVSPGVLDLGVFAPTEPQTPADSTELAIPGDRGPPRICLEPPSPQQAPRCLDDGLLVPIANPTQGGFAILALLSRAYDRVEALERAVHPETPASPPKVTVYFPQNGCGAGCYSGGVIATSTAASTTLVHEYGHHIHASFGSNQSPGGNHQCGQAVDPQLAWGEGVADFMAAFLLGTTGATCGNPEPPPFGALGQGNEANVQNTLWDLQDATPSEDPVAATPERFWSAFTSQPRNYGTVGGFLDRWTALHPEEAAAAHAVACQNHLAFEGC